ncbi:MAG: nitrilase-related carbon-nitrogen hydrolase [Solirubrobacteraceae bacterium]
MRRAPVLALLAALLLAAAAQAKTVRVFAVGPKFGLEWVDTRAHFHDHLVGLVDASKRGAGVQPEAGDVASHLLPGERNLVTFPEDLGLMAIFSGSRGEQARGSSDVTESIVAVLGAYAPQATYYGTKFPALASRGIPTRLLAIAATDTFARVAVETYAEIAATHKVWLEAGVNMAQVWHVVCQSKATLPALPGGVGCDEENAVKVAQLRTTDEPERTYAYEATTDRASNMALLFDPTGKLVSKQVKSYLTPIELPGQLDLLPGEVFSALPAVKTPVGTLGFVTSKDAWMPDVTARLDQQHVDLLIQPEFFVGDTVSTKGAWAPDNIKGSGYSDVLRHPSIESMVLPELTGNLFDLSADNQQAIVTKPRGPRPRGFLVGQPFAAGFAAVGDWVAPDPDPSRPPETIAQRRERLGKIGDQLLPAEANPPCPTPAARGVCRGGQVEDVIFADVQVARKPKVERVKRRKLGRTPFSINRPLAPSRRTQRNVALASRGKLVVAAFEERTAAGDRILLSRSSDGGRTWGRGRSVGRGAHRWWPSVAIGPDRRVWVAWSDDRTGEQRVYTAAGGALEGVAADATVADGVQQLRPAIAATGKGQAYVAFVDDRARFAGDDLPQAGIWGAAVDSNRPGKATRLDSTEPPVALAATLDHAWAPALAARGRRLELTWIDFRDYEWNVYARPSTDGGESWGDERQVNDTPDADEALEDTPRAALLRGGPLVTYTDWASLNRAPLEPSALYDVAVGAPGQAQIRADGSRGRHVEAFAPAIAAAGKSALVAWQDHRGGDGDILATRATTSEAGKPVREDDSGKRGWNQWRPALTVTRGAVLAAWEDERDGPAQIFFARARAGRLR